MWVGTKSPSLKPTSVRGGTGPPRRSFGAPPPPALGPGHAFVDDDGHKLPAIVYLNSTPLFPPLFPRLHRAGVADHGRNDGRLPAENPDGLLKAVALARSLLRPESPAPCAFLPSLFMRVILFSKLIAMNGGFLPHDCQEETFRIKKTRCTGL